MSGVRVANARRALRLESAGTRCVISRLPPRLHVTPGRIRFKLTVAATMRSRAPLFSVTLALSASVTACAAIWGFQDAIDRHDADAELGADATVDARDSLVETGTAASSDATDARTTAPNEGEATIEGEAAI